MTETLLIYFQPQQQRICCVLLNEQGKLLSQPEHGNLNDIAAIAKGKQATVLIDSACINIESVNIPGQNKQRQAQAVPFALEEQLATDIDDMHFAMGKKNSDQLIPVISIDRSLLENSLQQFRDAGVFVNILSADILALPFTENNWSILVDEDSAIIKTSHSNGYYCDRDNLAVILAPLLNKEDAPESITYFHKDDDSHAAELIADIDTTLNIKTYQSHAIEVFAKNLTDAQQLNILQGEYTPKRQSNLALKPWKSVAALFVAWLTVQMISAGIESQQLAEKNQALTSQIEKQFKLANPSARKFNNMRKRMERKLKQLKNGGSETDPLFLQILADAAPAFSKIKKVNIRGIVFRSQYVDMDLQAESLQSLEEVKNLLSANRKLKVVMSTSVEKNKTRGRLRLEAQG